MKIFTERDEIMKCKIIRREGKTVIPASALELGGISDTENLALLPMQGCVLLTKEQLSTYELVQLIDALSSHASTLLLTLAEDCGECAEEYRDIPLDELMQEFDLSAPAWALETAGIPKDAKLECWADRENGEIVLAKADYTHNVTDVPLPILQFFASYGYSLHELNERLISESEVEPDV